MLAHARGVLAVTQVQQVGGGPIGLLLAEPTTTVGSRKNAGAQRMSDQLRIGIVGLGFIGAQKHLVGLVQHKRLAENVAFRDFDIERAEAGKAHVARR